MNDIILRYAKDYLRILEENDVDPSMEEVKEAFISGWKHCLMRTKIDELYEILDSMQNRFDNDDDYGDA